MVDERVCKGGYRGLKKWIEEVWDHPPPAPFSRLSMQMLAPYPPMLRPTLDTIQKHLLLQEGLPESVQRPALSLRETMEMLELRHTQPALRNTQVPLAVPVATPFPPQLQPNPVESRSNLKKIVYIGKLYSRTLPQGNPIHWKLCTEAGLQPLTTLPSLSAKSLDVLDYNQLHISCTEAGIQPSKPYYC